MLVIKTLVICYCCFEVFGDALGELAKFFAEKLDTDVAIGDYFHSTDIVNGRFIVFLAGGEKKLGFENGGNFCFEVGIVDEA